MKRIIQLISFVTLIIVNVNAQDFWPYCTIKSINSKYSLDIIGRYYEGYGVNQKLILYRNGFRSREIYWIKDLKVNERSFHLPTVSNIGDVAVPFKHRYDFYDKDSKCIGRYLMPGNRTIQNGDDFRPHCYSPNGMLYFTFIFDSDPYAKSSDLVCLTREGVLKWKYTIGDYQENYLLCTEDRFIVNGKGIMIFDLDGRLMKSIESERSNFPIIYSKENALLINSNNKLSKYSLKDGRLIGVVNPNEVLDLIYSSNMRELNFILTVLNEINIEELNFDEKFVSRLEKIVLDIPSNQLDYTGVFNFSVNNSALNILKNVILKLNNKKSEVKIY